ncbi:receptor-type adenylate cyclase b [Leishmania mexicana MHOM/GT/2001/U1103]|uniref:adenylate cyclase n=1 Tax=Leishmania mexicana (strain MHOM/GT/2001/U1103) TaxID=929439 RepID=E9AQY4_LEIMU|nr:receptor-type adenylate cyclase b [Leishmania mexicana MHOM/GT/2001/U1103]CBZ25371.1 receptor-type adenylate cyclase b [Leishmania mexicana MHOM/GT/2001/U1103]
MYADTTHPRRACWCGAGGVAGCVKQRHAYRCSRLLAGTLLIVGALTLAVSTAPTAWAEGAHISSDEPVYLLNAMYSLSDYSANHAKALWLGIDSALHAASYTAAGGRPIRIIEPDPKVDLSDIVAVVKKALKDYPSLLGVIGPYSDTYLGALMSSPEIQSSGLMFLGPFTGSSALRVWNENLYFTRAEPRLEIMAMVKHIANTFRARRTAFMYLTGEWFGSFEHEHIVEVMTSLSLDPPAVYSVPYSPKKTGFDKDAFDAMADTHPQVIILWGIPGEQVAGLLQAVLTDPRTSSAYIMTCFALQQMTFQVYYDLAMAGKLTPVDGQIISSATSFPLTEPASIHLKVFRAQMGEYMVKTDRVDASLWADEAKAVRQYGPWVREAPPSDSDAYVNNFFNEHPCVTQLMIAGWISGSLIAQTVEEESWIADRTAYRKYIFAQQRYIIGEDFVLGDYGGPCGSLAEFLGAVCYCNQGGHSAVLSRLDEAVWTIIDRSGVSFTQKQCYSDETTLPRPLNFLTLIFEQQPLLAHVGMNVNKSIAALFEYIEPNETTANVATLNVTDTTPQALHDALTTKYTTDVILGTLARGVNVGEYLVPSPLYPRPHLVEPLRNYVYLMPTLEQQMFVLYAKLSVVRGVTSIDSTVHVIMHGYPSDELANITAVLYKSAATFNYKNPIVTAVPSTETVGSALVRRRINFVLAVTAADVADIVDFLVKAVSSIVVIVFDDLVIQYPTLVTALKSKPASVQARVITFSNLPLWSDTSESAHAASPLLTVFHAALPNPSQHTPGSLAAVITGSFCATMRRLTDTVDSTSLTGMIYREGSVSTRGVPFGAFQWGCTTTPTESLCVHQNYGAQGIVMLSVQRMLDPTVPMLSSPMTPTMEYSPRLGSHALTPAQRAGVIAGCVVGGVVLITTCTLILCCCIDSRDNDAAPKDGDEPVTLVFTDIESSTALWAALPQLMTEAIAAHHRVIRQLVKKYGCYEVKTIGDSFMIACKSAHSAVSLACEIQTKLLRHDWGTAALDSAYREFELARVDTLDDYVPPTAQLSEEEYAALWCGLRVRVGIHTGLADIRYDEVTKGYDYYGDTSNMAARTEAVANGGQVIATEAAWWALSNDERAGIAHTAMGPQGLRGVPFAVEMFQLNAVSGRRHAALRTEIEAIVPDETATETASSAAGALLSSVGTMNGPAAGVAFVLVSCFAPYPVAQRVRELQPLLSKWGVGAPPRSCAVSEEDYCQGLVNRLAVRITTVLQARQQMRNNEAGVSGDIQNFISSGLLNPFLGEGSFVADGARARHSGLTAVPPSAEPSAMRGQLVFRKPPERPAAFNVCDKH